MGDELKRREKPVPAERWKWYPAPLHFVGDWDCHLGYATLVGQYIVSTIGRYYPKSSNGEPAEIGYKRYAETYVFRPSGTRECGCPDIIPHELDSTSYGKNAECEEIRRGHLAMCKKWARYK